MIELSQGCTAYVVVNGEALKEYEVQEKISNNVKTLTCFIEAKKGDSYHVKIDDIIAVKDERLEVKVFVDGVLADVQYACPSKRDVGCNIKCKGFRIKGKDGHSVFQAFTFGDIPVTEDRSAEDITDIEKENANNIRIEITQKRRVGPIDHRTSTSFKRVLPNPSVVPKDSKPTLLGGLSIRYGQKIARKIRPGCYCKTVDNAEDVKLVITFQYRSHDWLVAHGLKKENQNERADVSVTEPHLCGKEGACSSMKRKDREDDQGASEASRRDKEENDARIDKELEDDFEKLRKKLKAVKEKINARSKVKLEPEEERRIAEVMQQNGGRPIVIVIDDD